MAPAFVGMTEIAAFLYWQRAIAPRRFAGAVFVVLHIGQSRSILPELLTKSGKLTASHPRAEEPISRGHIYVAPPDRHLLIEDGKVCLSRGPRKHFTRSAIDPLFRSAAATYGPRVIGVFWQRMQAQAEEQIETLRHFLERRPAVRFEPEKA